MHEQAEKQHPIQGLMSTTLEKIREMVDVNTVIGDPISAPDGSTIIPVSRVSFGFASGGSDLPSKQPKDIFGGASGAGISIHPIAFLVVYQGNVKLLQLTHSDNLATNVVGLVPDVMDKIGGLFKKDKPCDKKGEKKRRNHATHLEGCNEKITSETVAPGFPNLSAESSS